MNILDGRKISNEISEQLSSVISANKKRPKLVIIQIGHVPESDIYIGMKVRYAKKIGAIVEVRNFDESVNDDELLSQIEEMNQDSDVHGIIVQLPIPQSINLEKILNSISPEKDVDGLGAINISKLVRAGAAEEGIVPATARGVLDLLKAYKVDVVGKNVVIVGRSVLVGKSMALHFLNQDSTVSICHSRTKDLAKKTSAADILISAAGRLGLIGLENVNPHQVVIDVAISVSESGAIVGDVAPEVTKRNAVSAISLVPGGVGPMTVASLFQNLVETYSKQI